MKLQIVNGWSAPNALWAGMFEDLGQVDVIEVISLNKAHSAEAWSEKILSHIDGPTILMGWSLGAQLAMFSAARAFKKCEPEAQQIKGVVSLMANPSFLKTGRQGYGMSREEFLQFSSLLERQGKEALLKRFCALVCKGESSYKARYRELWDTYCNDLHAPSDEALANGLRLLEQLDISEVLGAVSCPQLWVSGAKDVLCPGVRHSKLTHLPAHKAREFVELNAGHSPFFDNKPLLVAEVGGFLEKYVAAVH